MSLNVAPICANCENSTEVSIPCTKCFRMCCTDCFSGLVSAMMTAKVDLALLTARICRKCIGEDAAAINEGAGNEVDAATQGICRLHGKMHTLYCLNCSVGICASCIKLGEPHNFHRVDNLDAVYLSEVSRVESKRLQAEKLNAELHAGCGGYRRNLELIQEEEKSVLQEIKAMAGSSTKKVSLITASRKELIEEKLKVPTENDAVLEDLRNEAKRLSPYELLERLPAFENKYDALIAQGNEVKLQKVDDIHCDLLPPYQFTKIVYCGFLNAANNHVCVFEIRTAYDVEWKFTVKKEETLQLVANAKDPAVQKLHQMLVVVIPHPDYSKTVYQSFELKDLNNTFDVVLTSYLVEQGFCRQNSGNLVIKVGIRCRNVLIERQLLKHQYEHVKQELSKLTAKHDNYPLIMHFNPALSDVVNDVILMSCQIIDDKEGHWAVQLEVKSNNLGLFVRLLNDPNSSCDYFIELLHSTHPKKTIIKRTHHKFDKSQGWGWSEFVSLDKVTNDSGYHPEGTLQIRFGVRISEAPSSGAAAFA